MTKTEAFDSNFTAQYTYKCRLCGLVHAHEHGGWHIDVIPVEMCVVTGGDPNGVFDVYKIAKTTYHLCVDGSFGVCDFIGVKKRPNQ